MFSHVVFFWTKSAEPSAAEALVAGAEKYLRHIDGIVYFHAGKMVPGERSVIEKSYQVALNIIFKDRHAQENYQVHPSHVEFVEKVYNLFAKKS